MRDWWVMVLTVLLLLLSLILASRCSQAQVVVTTDRVEMCGYVDGKSYSARHRDE